MRPQRVELSAGGMLGISHRGGRTVALETTRENFRGNFGCEVTAVEKRGGLAGGGIRVAREFHHGQPAEDEPAQGAFAAGAEMAVAIAHRDESGGAVRPLQLRGLEKNGELAGAVTRGVAGIPSRPMQDGDAGRLGLRLAGKMRRAEQPGAEHQQAKRSRASHAGVEQDRCRGCGVSQL